ncbi:hypothetical protein [Cyanothece sp. BG0011]|uniref:hypothetical protein n=1 Tax=Cyanothece sp. BG0011 TaxID=2082950 RepID=UPI00130036AD|nr:hypothetical protein [Cyanothece sp. BG0011]
MTTYYELTLSKDLLPLLEINAKLWLMGSALVNARKGDVRSMLYNCKPLLSLLSAE